MSDWSDGVALSDGGGASNNSAMDVVSMAGNAIGSAFGMPFVGSLVSGLFGKKGAKDANAEADRRQQQAQAFDAAQAQLNRDFQERMSNTAYERATNSMRRAGINPMLAYAQGGASTPSGSSASSPSPAPVINETAAGVDAATRYMASAYQAAQISNTEAATKVNEAQARKTQIEADMLEDESIYEGDTSRPFKDAEGRTRYEFKRDEDGNLVKRGHYYTRNEAQRVGTILERQKALLTQQQQFLVEQEVKNAIKEERLIEARTGNTEADTLLLRYRAAQEKATSDMWETIGSAGKWVSGIGKAVGGAASTALKLRRFIGR